MKECTKCEEFKDLSDFGKDSSCKNGIASCCKLCFRKQQREFRRTKYGLISTIYSNQKKRSKERGHKPPTYSRQDLEDWLMSQKKFHILYNNWKCLDYQRNYVPSVDRKNDYLGYTMNNIQLVTCKENNDKSHRDRKNGINNKMSKTVLQYDLEMNLVDTFYSLSEAIRQTGIKSIGDVCRGYQKTTGGYIWNYKQ